MDTKIPNLLAVLVSALSIAPPLSAPIADQPGLYRQLTLAPATPPADGEGAAESGGADDLGNIAQKLNNPVSSLISVPLQNNFDFGGGPRDEGFQYRLNVQPVIPFPLGDNWNLITRTIVPFITQSGNKQKTTA